MTSRKLTVAPLALMSLLWLSNPERATAQSSIVNVPSTDVVAAEKLYLEMDFITNYAWQSEDDRFTD